jgi:hypothetical protein
MQLCFRGLHRAGLEEQNACYDLQAVRDAVLHFLKQDLFLPQQFGHLTLAGSPLGDIFDRQKNESVFVTLIKHGPRVEQHCAASDSSEVVLDFVSLHDRMLRQDFLKQNSELGNIPLTIAQRIDGTALHILPTELECLIERAADRNDTEIFIQHQQRLADGIHDRLGQGTSILNADELSWDHEKTSNWLRAQAPDAAQQWQRPVTNAARPFRGSVQEVVQPENHPSANARRLFVRMPAPWRGPRKEASDALCRACLDLSSRVQDRPQIAYLYDMGMVIPNNEGFV